jgi:Rrf2 family protein
MVPAPTSIQFTVAVHVLTYLALTPPGIRVGSPEIAESVDTSAEYVRRVLVPLRAAGIVESRPGRSGGWVLDRDASSITLAEVWELVVRDQPAMAAHEPNPTCDVGRKVQRAMVDIEHGLTGAIIEHLRAITVADVIADER